MIVSLIMVIGLLISLWWIFWSNFELTPTRVGALGLITWILLWQCLLLRDEIYQNWNEIWPKAPTKVPTELKRAAPLVRN